MAEQLTQPRCDGCFFWRLFDTPKPDDDEDPNHPDFVDLRGGRCHRYPPTLNATALQANIANHVKLGGIERNGLWTDEEFDLARGLAECGFSWERPVTYANDFCGEWKPAALAKPAGGGA